MKEIYKGYAITAELEGSMFGPERLYFSVYRESDGLEIICGSEDSEETERGTVEEMKGRVDEFIMTKGASEFLEEYF